jgi:hypothetical protein
MSDPMATHAGTTKTCTPRGPSEPLDSCPNCNRYVVRFPCFKCGWKPGDEDKKKKLTRLSRRDLNLRRVLDEVGLTEIDV